MGGERYGGPPRGASGGHENTAGRLASCRFIDSLRGSLHRLLQLDARDRTIAAGLVHIDDVVAGRDVRQTHRNLVLGRLAVALDVVERMDHRTRRGAGAAANVLLVV